MTDLSVEIPRPKKRVLYLAAQVTQKSMNDLTKAIVDINSDDRQLEKLYPICDIEYKPKPIQIYIDSYGGAVYQCFGLLGVMQKKIEEITLARTNISQKKLTEVLKNKVDWYMTAEEALRLGVIDGIV